MTQYIVYFGIIRRFIQNIDVLNGNKKVTYYYRKVNSFIPILLFLIMIKLNKY